MVAFTLPTFACWDSCLSSCGSPLEEILAPVSYSHLLAPVAYFLRRPAGCRTGRLQFRYQEHVRCTDIVSRTISGGAARTPHHLPQPRSAGSFAISLAACVGQRHVDSVCVAFTHGEAGAGWQGAAAEGTTYRYAGCCGVAQLWYHGVSKHAFVTVKPRCHSTPTSPPYHLLPLTPHLP